jgi:hypothetical protein
MMKSAYSRLKGTLMYDLAQDLMKELQRHRRLATVNYQAAYWFSALAVLASVMAGLSVASDWFSKDKLAILSTLPGAILILFDRLKFEERADWHYRRTYALRSLMNDLTLRGVSEAEVSTRWEKMANDMEQQWPRFGRGSTKGTNE